MKVQGSCCPKKYQGRQPKKDSLWRNILLESPDNPKWDPLCFWKPLAKYIVATQQFRLEFKT